MPGGGQLKHWLNNVAQMHTHESWVLGRGTTAVACLRKCTLWMQTKQMDPSHLCVLPLVTHWEMLPYWIEKHQTLHWSKEESLGYPMYLGLFFFITCNGNRDNGIDQRKSQQKHSKSCLKVIAQNKWPTSLSLFKMDHLMLSVILSLIRLSNELHIAHWR